MRALVRRGEARAGIEVRCQGADAGVARTAVPGGEEWSVRRQDDDQGPPSFIGDVKRGRGRFLSATNLFDPLRRS